MAMVDDNLILALFCDFENVALGVRDAKYAKFDIRRVLERLLVKGSIVVKKAYCDWDRYKEFKQQMHEAAFELIEIPHVRVSGKNSADIRLVVDALDLCYTKSHVDTFVIISGDSDFSPLVSKLRENAKTVIGVGVKNSTSDLLIRNCDEFIFYDDLVREQENSRRQRRRSPPPARRPAPVVEATPVEAVAAPVAAPSAPPAVEPAVPAEIPVPAAALADTPAEPAADGVADAAPAPAKRRPRRTTKAAKEKAAAEAEAAAAAAVEAPAAEAVADVAPPAAATDVAQASEAAPPAREDDRMQAAIDLIIETAEAMQTARGDEGVLWGSMIKQALKRRRPEFNESYYGVRSFKQLLEEAQARGQLDLEHDERSGGYIVRRIVHEE